MGVMVGSAVPPIAFCITWKKISAAGAISGAVTGLFGAIITWICTAKVSWVGAGCGELAACALDGMWFCKVHCTTGSLQVAQ